MASEIESTDPPDSPPYSGKLIVSLYVSTPAFEEWRTLTVSLLPVGSMLDEWIASCDVEDLILSAENGLNSGCPSTDVRSIFGGWWLVACKALNPWGV